ncbi:MAG: hypothetical protein CL676_06130 [Bdellovibrionaceae bacterium]|nr:hypothetical protein [Pseudobdellovibrionaceae bacterium]
MRPGLHFPNGKLYSVHRLRQDIETIIKLKKNIQFEVKRQSNCLHFKLSAPIPNLPNELSKLKNAPTEPSFIGNFEEGLGEFRYVQSSPNEIELERIRHSDSGFNRIKFHDFESSKDNIDWFSVEDFNRISIELIPDEIKKEYLRYSVSLLQTAILMINLQSIDDRQKIYGCLDVKKFRKAFSPGQEEFSDTHTVIPSGLGGRRIHMPNRNCKGSFSDLSHAITFLNWKVSSSDELRTFFKRFGAGKIKVKDISAGELAMLGQSRSKDFDLMVVGVSADDASAIELYESIFVDNHGMFREVPMKIRQLVRQLKVGSPKAKENSLVELEIEIARQALILPIFETSRDIYYPKRVDRITFGRQFLEIPLVEDLKL